MDRINIAIDGPAGAGKSTIAKLISKKLGIIYLDTGAMYRAVALKAIRNGIDTSDRKALSKLVGNISIEVTHICCEQHIFLDNEDVTGEIRTPEVSRGASDVAVVPEVRIRMADIQRKIAGKNNVVMDGRDIGTYVLPESKYKIFLTASVRERARRRFKEQLEKGMADISPEQVQRDIEYRDKNDSCRDLAPLARAADAVEIDTTDMTIDEVVDKIISYIKT